MIDTVTNNHDGSNLISHQDWAPSDSEDDSNSELKGTQNTMENTCTSRTQNTGTTATSFIDRESVNRTWNFLQYSFGIFQCQGKTNAVSDDIEEYPKQGSKSNAKHSPSTSASNQPRDPLRELASADKKQTQQKLKKSFEAARQRDREIPHKILEEPIHHFDGDTFLSDDFTPMEQGWFNHAFDQVCKPIVSAAKGREDMLCSTMDDPVMSNSVFISFDDTISKLTHEGGHVDSPERNKVDVVRDRDSISSKEQTVKKHHPSASKNKASADKLSRQKKEPLSEPVTSSDNVIVVTFNPEQEEVSIQSLEESDPYEATGKAHAIMNKPSKSMRKRLLLHIRKKIKKIKKVKKKKKLPNEDRSTNTSVVEVIQVTPPHKSIARDKKSVFTTSLGIPGSGSSQSTTDPCSESSISEKSHLTGNELENTLPEQLNALVEQIYVQVDAKEQTGKPVPYFPESTSGTKEIMNKEFSQTPEVLQEQVELVAAPLNMASTNSQSALILSTSQVHTNLLRETLETVNEEGGAVTEWSPYEEDDSDDSQELNDMMADTFFLHEAMTLPQEVQNNGNEDHHTACSSITPSLITMTSRFEEEREETEQLRIILQKKDEDLERLRELLERNDYKNIVARIRGSSSSSHDEADRYLPNLPEHTPFP